MRQVWRDAVFLHWRVAPDLVAPLLPRGTEPDVLDGTSWVGLIPFRMCDAGFGVGPAVPWLGTFTEVNVRLYSRDAGGNRGVVFRSLDTDRVAVVLGARAVFGTPYVWSRVRFEREGDVVRYIVRRRRGGAGSALSVRIGAVRDADDVDTFLTARFGLHTRWAGRTLWVPNTHAPWSLHDARLESLDDGLLAAAGLPGVSVRPPDSVLHSPGVRTEFGFPRRVA